MTTSKLSWSSSFSIGASDAITHTTHAHAPATAMATAFVEYMYVSLVALVVRIGFEEGFDQGGCHSVTHTDTRGGDTR